MRGYSEDFIQKCQNFLYTPGISVVKDALLANQSEVHAMHDPTEGGLSAGLYEIAVASQSGMLIMKDKIPILEESTVLCKEFNIDPLGTITSGTLLIVAPKESALKIVSLLEKNGIKAALIGEIRERDFGIKIKSNQKVEDLKFSSKDEITRIFE